MSAILDHLINDHHATMAEAKAAMVGWDLIPIEHDGIKVGEVMMMNNEVHMALYPSERNKAGRRGLLYKYVNKLLDEKGFLVTRLFKNDKYRRKIEAIGFLLTHSDSQFDYFWLNKKEATL